MMSRTHIPVGIACALALAPPHPLQMVVYAAAGGVGAILPDIDSHHSKIGRKLRIISDVVEHVAGHRKLFHSLAGAAGIFALAYILLRVYHPLYLILLVPLLIGYLSHLVLDTMAGGVPWLFPVIKKRYGLHVKTNGLIERLLFRPVAIAFMLFVMYRAVLPMVKP